MKRLRVLAWSLVLGTWALPVHGQVIDTVAGTTWLFPSNIQALSAPLGNLGGIAVDAQGRVVS